FSVEWVGVPHALDAGSRLTFEAVLFEGSGEIQFHYLSMLDGVGGSGSGLVSGSSATIGIERADGAQGSEVSYNRSGAVTSGSGLSFTLGSSAFQQGRRLGDLDGDSSVTILDQSILTDEVIDVGLPVSSLLLSLSDVAPRPGVGGRAFGDGILNGLDHDLLFDVLMGRTSLNPTLSESSYIIAAPGEVLTLKGSGFDPVAGNNAVIFERVDGTEVAATPDSVNAAGTELIVTVPAGGSFTWVRVESNGRSSNAFPFYITGAPVLTELIPNNGQAGDQVLIRGHEFGAAALDNTVRFNGVAAAVLAVSSGGISDELTATVPAAAGSGPVTVTVGGVTSNSLPFIYDGPPVVSITSPANNVEINGPTNIVGSVTDLSLIGYRLEMAPAGGSFTVFATGTSPVTNGVLGLLDTTLLANGMYEVRLVAEDSSGNISSLTRDLQISGQNKVGMFTISFMDLSVPVSGIPIQVTRTYDTRNRMIQGDFGMGWRLDVGASGTYQNNRQPGEGWYMTSGGGFFNWPCSNSNESKSHVTEVRFSDTEFYRFRLRVNMYGTGSMIGGGCIGDVYFEQIGGIPGATLAILDETAVFWGNGSDTLTYDIDSEKFGQVYEPGAVRLTTLDGRQFDVDLQSGVTRVEDTNGNELFISSAGVVHSSGRAINFTRDAQGRITRITDPMGDVLDYAYNGSGDLISATDRDSNTTTFTYDNNHYLLEVHDPLGNVPVRNEYDTTGRLVAQVDASGNRIEISADVANNTTTMTDRAGNTSVIEYNTAGLITSATTDSGAETSYTYDANGNKTSETDPLGNTRHYTYDASNRLLSEQDALGNTINYGYNASGRITGMTDANGHLTSYAYDASGNLLSITDFNGVVTNAFSYDAAGRITQATALGGTNLFNYDAYGNVVRRQGPGGVDATYTYDANGRRLTETKVRTTPSGVVNETTTYAYNGSGKVSSVTDASGGVTSFTYNGNGQVTSRTDARGNTTLFQYDVRGYLVRTTYPDGTFVLSGYDEKGRKNAEMDRAGRTTFTEYNERDLVTRKLFADASDVVNGYDAAGNLVTARDNRGQSTIFAYNAARRMVSVTNPLGNSMLMSYNTLGAKTSQTDPLSRVTQFGYDESVFGLPRVTQTTFADGSIRMRTYAPIGLIATETDEAGGTTTLTYDAAGRLTRVTDALGNQTDYTYDEAGNRITETDARGHVTTYEYDANRHVTKRTLPLGMSETMSYDAVGNLTSHTDFNGAAATYTYDSMNRLVTKTLPGGDVHRWTYALSGKVSTLTEPRGVTTYTYDVRDRVTRIINPDGTVLDYTYDVNGNRTSVRTPTGTTAYTYDTASRLSVVTDPNGGLTIYTYDAADNIIKITRPNGTETYYTYDARNRMTRAQHTGASGSPTLAQYDYLMDSRGMRTRMTDALSGLVVNYTYDLIGRLTSENRGGSVTSYTYDAVGNRLTKGGEGYTYDVNNRLLTAGAAVFTYDNNGNLLTRSDLAGLAQYTYDGADRLIQHVAPDSTVSTFSYDAYGNRVSRNTNGAITDFLVDPMDRSGYPQVLLERDGGGSSIASYVYGNGLIRANIGGAVSYYHPDALGSTRALTNALGVISDTYDYDAFGNMAAQTGTTANAYLFAGEQMEPAMDLYYMRARYMDPQTGRFTSMDPFAGSPFDPMSLHKYVYALNNPVNITDPSGEFSMMSISISIAIVGIMSSIAYATVIKPGLDAYDKIKKLVEDIPKMKLNENA
ncbi:MAG: RHS repeat-associated core domain-containing protein, partial [Nitrospirota bacterium]|nr:RHS repeat-associated core domain-containing protein [Nitrospirota bacterium]